MEKPGDNRKKARFDDQKRLTRTLRRLPALAAFLVAFQAFANDGNVDGTAEFPLAAGMNSRRFPS